ncbi:ANTAR domain-containing protein [Amycolatopsis thailandensis]|uniref:ANTAR domain-containing protein n=1 Tax=Amycolatopsis thailandensis TaxID=589330 RepID=UPI00378AE274
MSENLARCVDARTTTGQPRTALTSRAVIDQAKGVLMAVRQVDEDGGVLVAGGPVPAGERQVTPGGGTVHRRRDRKRRSGTGRTWVAVGGVIALG